MAWVFLIIAGLFEIGWPLGFKLAQTTHNNLLWISFSVVAMALSGWFLFMAQKDISIGVAYASWTGIGALGTFLIGIFFFGDGSSLLSWMGILLIVSGIAMLKLAH